MGTPLKRGHFSPFPVCLRTRSAITSAARARSLRLNHQDLKHHIHPPVPLRPSPAFVELTMPSGTHLVECSNKIEKPSGERMRIGGSCIAIVCLAVKPLLFFCYPSSLVSFVNLDLTSARLSLFTSTRTTSPSSRTVPPLGTI